MKKHQDHPLLQEWLYYYRETGKPAEVTNTNALWPLAAARSWTAWLKVRK